jgi:hypothetical protein
MGHRGKPIKESDGKKDYPKVDLLKSSIVRFAINAG